VEPSSAWLQWLVAGAGHELMLFASVGILLIGIDDLLFDLLWLAMPRKVAAPPLGAESRPLDGRIAVFIPAWDEAEVLPATLRRMLAAWAGENVRLYVGCYPNDVATLFSVSPLVARDARLRLVVGETEGPTTKGDNLNRLWAALGEDERMEGRRFAAVVLHDAEDHVHADEIALYRRHLGDHAMVQIPVVPMVTGGSRWIGGHYGDEFAEAHGKELALRSRLGVPIPSAGVGCALTRNALSLLAIERGGYPFRADSLTEDYEVGMLIGAYGLRACFADSLTATGDRIVSRGGFPGSIEHAVRQKSRWIAGIALAGWDHLGWLGARFSGGEASRWRIWLARWMLWRDRRSPLAALVLLAAYLGLIASGLSLAGEALLGWESMPLGGGMRVLFTLNAALLLWRLAMRVHFTARWYGTRQALLAVPRAFVANVIAMLAARRAVALYWRMLRSGQVLWEKTEHRDGETAPGHRVVRS
jgi:adsorption protein B